MGAAHARGEHRGVGGVLLSLQAVPGLNQLFVYNSKNKQEKGPLQYILVVFLVLNDKTIITPASTSKTVTEIRNYYDTSIDIDSQS